jgi:hypothetical protein
VAGRSRGSGRPARPAGRRNHRAPGEKGQEEEEAMSTTTKKQPAARKGQRREPREGSTMWAAIQAAGTYCPSAPRSSARAHRPRPCESPQVPRHDPPRCPRRALPPSPHYERVSPRWTHLGRTGASQAAPRHIAAPARTGSDANRPARPDDARRATSVLAANQSTAPRSAGGAASEMSLRCPAPDATVSP